MKKKDTIERLADISAKYAKKLETENAGLMKRIDRLLKEKSDLEKELEAEVHEADKYISKYDALLYEYGKLAGWDEKTLAPLKPDKQSKLFTLPAERKQSK